MNRGKIKVEVEVDPNSETTIKPFGEKLTESVTPDSVGDTTVSATGTSTNPPDSDGDGDID